MEILRCYKVNDKEIELSAKKFFPPRQVNEESVMLVLSGWGVGTPRTLEYLTQRYAQESNQIAWLVDTHPKGILPNSLSVEARAIGQFVSECELKEVIIVGYSQGHLLGVELINLFQTEQVGTKVVGLISLNPVGLLRQDRRLLLARWVRELFWEFPKSFMENVPQDSSLKKKVFDASGDIFFNTIQRISSSKGQYLVQLWHSVREIAQANFPLHTVNCPIVLIAGAFDFISTAGLGFNPKYRIRELFPHNPNVCVLLPRKLGHHGLPHFRPDEVAKVSVYILEKLRRKLTSQTLLKQ